MSLNATALKPQSLVNVNDTPHSSKTQSKTRTKQYAYVLMAYDVPGAPIQHIWRALALVRSLQRLSDFPILLMTNTSHFPDGTHIRDAFGRLNCHVLPVHEVPLPTTAANLIMPFWRVAFWKLQIWRLVEYDKLIWLDADAIVMRSLDYLFDRVPTWGQKDAWVCSANTSAQNWLCSGLMLIEPSEETYWGLLKYAATKKEWWKNGDQKLIDDYFREVRGDPVKLLDVTEAAFGKCLGRIPNLFRETPGEVWNMPAFVHKSSVHNECFYFLIAAQLREIQGHTVNICHFNPLGAAWRDAFCDGLRIGGVRTRVTRAYCNDALWYVHTPPSQAG
eukprot:CAMPEP_0172667856 /NCGR_PEP_ID=MMETSP1074-20121228/8693_1 /TAXON_ID=2916 /ORGANISM="Ceratium fusus, Strain PA161109" /LENGTH=332 /DNA_ID=CAMNT_0013484425 /DNA_START=231 /DNA_END=1229 /DNA_ORIENTATION=+